jgi:superoxide reductase
VVKADKYGRKEDTMKQFGELYQTADWKTEKHVPVIECPDQVKAGDLFPVKVTLGKEVAHPNTTAHHIRWISVYFHPEGEKFAYQIGHFEFSVHGESTEGPDTSSIYTHHEASTSMKTSKPGTLYATALCNIHGLWYSAKEIKIT